MNQRKKLTSQQQTEEQLYSAEQRQQSQSEQKFSTVEEMLRHDALHTPVPPAIARRLQDSLAQLPSPPPRSWWQRFFGGDET